MPAYNCEAYIGEAIESVLSQTFTDWELVVIDDCSTDNTVSEVGRYLSDERILLLQSPVNLGGAGARNLGIERACGRYMAFLDSDDAWLPEKLEKQVKFMRKNGAALSYTAYEVIDEKGKHQAFIPVRETVTYGAMLKHNYIACLTAMYDTELVGKVFMPDVRKRQDFALWLKILSATGKGFGLNECLGRYRVRPGSLSASTLDAIRYYWRVVRSIEGVGVVRSGYSLLCYVGIVGLKKKAPRLYYLFMVRR